MHSFYLKQLSAWAHAQDLGVEELLLGQPANGITIVSAQVRLGHRDF